MTDQGVLAGLARGIGQAAGWIGSLPVRLRLLQRDWADARSEQKRKAQLPTVEERQSDLIAFYNGYEDLVETVCDAAQMGAKPKLAERYLRLRAWMQVEYPKVRPFVTAYLPLDADDANLNMGFHSGGYDAFEALYAAPTIENLLEGDDGLLIERVMRTREALSLYGEHLRRLKGHR